MISDSIVEQIRRNLIDFGYTGLTSEDMRTTVNKIEAGEKPTDIIGMMAKSQLVENGLIDEDD